MELEFKSLRYLPLLPSQTSSLSSVIALDSIPFLTSLGLIPCTTRSIRESSENCLPDMRIPRTRRRIAGESWFCRMIPFQKLLWKRVDLLLSFYRNSNPSVNFGQEFVRVENRSKRSVHDLGRHWGVGQQKTRSERFVLLASIWRGGKFSEFLFVNSTELQVEHFKRYA